MSATQGRIEKFSRSALILRALALMILWTLFVAPVAEGDRILVSFEQGENGVRVLAHRGASGLAPENTFAAWDLAWKQGADYIELDIQMTQDQVLVAMHDSTLNRTARGPAADCSGSVSEKTLAQLRSCEVGSWFNEAQPDRARPEYVGLKIPTLEGVFRRYGREANYYVELKHNDPVQEEELIRLLNEFELRRPAVRTWRVVIQSFVDDTLQRIHRTNPRLPLSQLFGRAGSPQAIEDQLEWVSSYADAIGPEKADVDSGLVETAHFYGLEVHTYTVDDVPTMTALRDLGVDGIFTNFPRRLRRL